MANVERRGSLMIHKLLVISRRCPTLCPYPMPKRFKRSKEEENFIMDPPPPPEAMDSEDSSIDPPRGE